MNGGNMEEKIKYRIGFLVLCLALLFFIALQYLDVLSGAMVSKDSWLKKNYLFLAVGVMVVFGGFGAWLLKEGEKKLWVIYAPLVLILGIFYLFVLPPLSAPDEISHYISAYQLSNRLMGKQATYQDGHVLIRAQDLFLEDVQGDYEFKDKIGTLEKPLDKENKEKESVVLSRVLDEGAYRLIHQVGLSGRGNADTKDLPEDALALSQFPPVITTPIAYFPQALGISLARIGNMNSLGLAYMGRFFNLLFFVFITTLTIKILPVYKEIYFGVNLLPMVLHLAASFSYDAYILSLWGLYIAICLWLALKKEKVSVKDVALLAIIVALAGPCKMVYAPLMGVALFIPVKKFGGIKKMLLAGGVVFLFWAVAMYLVNHQVITNYAVETQSYVGWAKEEGYSLQYSLHHPFQTLKVFYQSWVSQGDFYHRTMIGGYLGNMDPILDIPYIVVLGFSACLLVLGLRQSEEKMVFSKRNRIWIFLMVGMCIFLVQFSMLIAWTPISSKYIQGVQGRYFLPCLPLILMALKNKKVILQKCYKNIMLVLMLFGNCYALCRIFSIVCLRISN